MTLVKEGELWKPEPDAEDVGWVWDEQEGKRHRVSLRVVSGTPGRALPKRIAALPVELVLDFSNMTEVAPQPSFEDVREGGGVWRFAGWEPASRLATLEDLDFEGTWVWQRDGALGPVEAEAVRPAGLAWAGTRRPKHAAPPEQSTPSVFAAGYVAASTAAAVAVGATAVAAVAAWAFGRRR